MKAIYDAVAGLLAFGIAAGYPIVALIRGASYGAAVMKAWGLFVLFYVGFCVLLPMALAQISKEFEKKEASTFLAEMVTFAAAVAVGLAFPAVFGLLGLLVRSFMKK
jgi:hypothetical protein